jgi:SAM-dependent methyltransferase
MGEKISSWRAVLSNPLVFELFHRVIGADRQLKNIVRDYVQPREGDIILDIGCGPGRLARYLPHVRYVGFDHSQCYIDAAKRHAYGHAEFICDDVANFKLYSLPPFDVVMAVGILHHLDDTVAARLFDLAKEALKPGGRLFTIDPCHVDGQAAITRLLISLDRGQNIRTSGGYLDLARRVFPATKAHLCGHVPYWPSVCILECSMNGVEPAVAE